jgi:hypothetical protein
MNVEDSKTNVQARMILIFIIEIFERPKLIENIIARP